MNEQELNKLSKEEIYKLYNQGKLSAEEVESLPRWEQEKLNAILLRKKKAEIKEEYRKGELSKSDTITYELLRVLDRNRQNTSTIVTVIAVNIIIIVIGLIVVAVSNS